MTDFYTQLEHDLVAAGHRRQVQGRAARAVAGRGRALAAATAVALVGAGAAFALPAALETTSTSAPAVAPKVAPATAPAAIAANVAGIRVMVLNGTTRTGVARHVADRLEGLRAVIVGTSNAPDQTVPATLVYYLRGKRAQAVRVARALSGPAAVAPLPRTLAPLMPARDAAGADVIVLAGADGLRQPPIATPGPATPKAPHAVTHTATAPLSAVGAPPAASGPVTPSKPLPAPAATVPAPAAKPAPAAPVPTVPSRPAKPKTP